LKAESLKIGRVFSSGGEILYLLPEFQREYAWERENWDAFLQDLDRIYAIYDPNDPERTPEHFMGALVVVNDGLRGTIPVLKLVDGQQRLTTISLALCALADVLGSGHPDHKKIRKRLINEDEVGDTRYKLLPTRKNGDRDIYKAIIGGDGAPITAPTATRSRIDDAYQYLRDGFSKRLSEGMEAQRYFLVIDTCLQVVFIQLDQKERPYEIFESLNAKGKPLTQPDLIRNYIAMMLPERRQAEAFASWQRIEMLLNEARTVGRIGEQTAFIRHWLAFEEGELYSKDHIYARFRDRMNHYRDDADGFIVQIETLAQHAARYDQIVRPARHPDSAIQRQLERLAKLDSSTSYPLLLHLFDLQARDVVSHETLIDSLGVVENYLVRRALANSGTQYVNRMFPTVRKNIDSTRLSESLRAVLGRSNYPSDNAIREAMPRVQFYAKGRDNRFTVFFLNTINRSLSEGTGGYTVLDAAPTIEHIMPQKLSTAWERELGTAAAETHLELLDTIGNLTLVTQTWNSEFSNKPFAEKQRRLAENALLINGAYFGEPLARWDAEAIRARAAALVDRALTIWSPFIQSQPTVPSRINPTPTHLRIRGTYIAVNSWKDVLRAMFRFADEVRAADFEQFAAELNSAYLRRETGNKTEPLANDWHIYTSLNSANITSLCERIAPLVGLDDDQWDIVLPSGSV